jgi:hypothetical protein
MAEKRAYNKYYAHTFQIPTKFKYLCRKTLIIPFAARAW